ncbi:MAG: PIN domain-containing protein [Steroidobacteraceae bacterium]
MSALVFVDTNVLVYARQAHEPQKQPVAAQWIDRLWREQIGRTSIQVLNECYAALTRAVRRPPSSMIVWDFVHSLLAWNPQPVDADVLVRAFEIEQRHRLSWWDCLVVAAAQLQGCGVLLTEDLQDRAVYGGVTVRNPFAMAASEDLGAYSPYGADVPVHPRRGRPRRARG